MEAFPALFRGPGTDQAGDAHPIVRAMGLDESDEQRVFLGRPGSSSVGLHIVGLGWCWVQEAVSS